MVKDNEWADELVYLLSTLLLNRPIKIFSVVDKFPAQVNYFMENRVTENFLIGYNEFHFVPIIPMEGVLHPILKKSNDIHLQTFLGCKFDIDLD